MFAKNHDYVFSFDTTGSMYACLAQVRQRIIEMANRILDEIPGARIGIIAHGDYCDRDSTYVTRRLELTNDRQAIIRFVNNVPATYGGDSPECYEQVLHEARSFAWGPGKKTLVLIGDDVPHHPGYRYEGYTNELDWRVEIDHLINMGVNVYGMQALDRDHATSFYREIAKRTGGYHLRLDQFSNAADLILAICYQQVGVEVLTGFETRFENEGRMNRNMDEVFAVLLRRETPSTRFRKSRDLEAVPPGRFQVMRVYGGDAEGKISIRDFVENNSLIFEAGKGFYEFNKSELIQGHKEVVLRENETGDLYSGNKAREMLGLPARMSKKDSRTSASGKKSKTKPNIPDGFTAFVQSTSYNRNLIDGTEFLYEVDLSR